MKNLKMWRLNHSGSTWPVSWLLMPWILASSWYQHQLYRLCRIAKFLSYTKKDFNYLCKGSMEEWLSIQLSIHFCFLCVKKFSTWRTKPNNMKSPRKVICQPVYQIFNHSHSLSDTNVQYRPLLWQIICTYMNWFRFSLLLTWSSLQSLETQPTLTLVRAVLQTLAWDAALN